MMVWQRDALMYAKRGMEALESCAKSLKAIEESFYALSQRRVLSQTATVELVAELSRRESPSGSYEPDLDIQAPRRTKP